MFKMLGITLSLGNTPQRYNLPNPGLLWKGKQTRNR
jgi:hypothetical protein